MKDMTNIEKAKITLGVRHPFIAGVLYNIPIETADTCPVPCLTACTDGKKIWYNEKFVDTLTHKETMFLLAHECMHCMMLHALRCGGRDKKKWNVATDYVINQLLVDDKVGDMPKAGLLDAGLYRRGEGASERVYDLLPADEGGEGKKPLDEVLMSSATGAEAARLERDMKQRIAYAAQVSKKMGKLSAGMERFVDALLKPVIRWTDVLERFMTRCVTDDRSWSRLNRRFVCQHLMVPAADGACLGDVVVAIDCSGSIGAEELKRFGSELRSIVSDCQPACTHVLYFDSEVTRHDTFQRGEDLTLSQTGGGGTAFSPIFRYCLDNEIDPVCCVVLTDLYCSDFGTEPDYPVLWVTTGAEKAPFGEVVRMKQED